LPSGSLLFLPVLERLSLSSRIGHNAEESAGLVQLYAPLVWFAPKSTHTGLSVCCLQQLQLVTRAARRHIQVPGGLRQQLIRKVPILLLLECVLYLLPHSESILCQ